MRGTVEETRVSSQTTLSYEFLYMNVPVLADQQRLTNISLEDLSEVMDDRDGWRETEGDRERERER